MTKEGTLILPTHILDDEGFQELMNKGELVIVTIKRDDVINKIKTDLSKFVYNAEDNTLEITGEIIDE